MYREFQGNRVKAIVQPTMLWHTPVCNY